MGQINDNSAWFGAEWAITWTNDDPVHWDHVVSPVASFTNMV